MFMHSGHSMGHCILYAHFHAFSFWSNKYFRALFSLAARVPSRRWGGRAPRPALPPARALAGGARRLESMPPSPCISSLPSPRSHFPGRRSRAGGARFAPRTTAIERKLMRLSARRERGARSFPHPVPGARQSGVGQQPVHSSRSPRQQRERKQRKPLAPRFPWPRAYVSAA